jgi:predicted transposase/invertase (TIGR01784 family)
MSGPHDLFVRFTFDHPERAAAELRAALPSYVVAQVDWSSLRRVPGSVVDVELRETEIDLLFSARLSSGRPVLFYILLEHQSSVDRWMALRMLRYVVRQLEHWRQEHSGGELLPVIIPVVLYHGPEGPWTAPLRVEELFDVPSEGDQPERWRALVPRFEYRVDDLTAQRAEALMARPGPPLVRLALLALRYGRTEELTERLPAWEALLVQLRAGPTGVDELTVLFQYLLRVASKTVHTTMVAMLKNVVGPERTEKLMETWAEMHEERGRQQGITESLLRLLAARGIPVDAPSRQRIMSCTDIATLDQWFDRAVNATQLSEVFGDLTQSS